MSEPTFEASEPTGDAITPTFKSAVARKQNFNIYTVMLIISFFCLMIGTLLLFLELQSYGNLTDWPWKVDEGQPREVLALFGRFLV